MRALPIGARCSLDGAIVAEGTPREFFSSGSFYTTSASRMGARAPSRRDHAGRCDHAAAARFLSEPELPDEALQERQAKPGIGSRGENVSSSKRDPAASLVAQADRRARDPGHGRRLIRILRISDLSELLTEGGLTSLAGDTFKLYLAMLVSLFVVAVSIQPRRAAAGPLEPWRTAAV